MNILDYLLLTLIGGYSLYLLFRKKKLTGCSGNCASCHGGCCNRKTAK